MKIDESGCSANFKMTLGFLLRRFVLLVFDYVLTKSKYDKNLRKKIVASGSMFKILIIKGPSMVS